MPYSPQVKKQTRRFLGEIFYDAVKRLVQSVIGTAHIVEVGRPAVSSHPNQRSARLV
jgi:hypothetical protein